MAQELEEHTCALRFYAARSHKVLAQALPLGERWLHALDEPGLALLDERRDPPLRLGRGAWPSAVSGHSRGDGGLCLTRCGTSADIRMR